MNRAFAPCLAIFAAALAFRIPDLADRPMHADEAVLADKFAGLLETGRFPYDPQDYQGPALAWLTLAPAWIAGAHRYADLTETTLRIVPALCGVLLVLVPLLLWDGLGRWAAMAAGIAVVCMLLALAATVRRKPSLTWPVVAAAAIAILIPVAALGFTDSWRALMSYWQRGIHGSMHRRAWDYYLVLLVRNEGLIVAAAVLGATRRGSGLLKFLAVYACAMMVVYSLIPYKTPWCVLGPLDAMILLAGAGVAAWAEWLPRTARVAFAILLAVVCFQAWRASFPLSSDPRNLWPLPWYLRAFPHVEWWRSLGPGYRPADVIIVTPEMEPALVHELYEVPPPGSRGLYRSIFDRYMEVRPQVELRGYIRASL
jgi:predicted membrane-bound mannosyltransferase